MVGETGRCLNFFILMQKSRMNLSLANFIACTRCDGRRDESFRKVLMNFVLPLRLLRLKTFLLRETRLVTFLLRETRLVTFLHRETRLVTVLRRETRFVFRAIMKE